MVIAWRINRLMRLGRNLPDLPADLLFETDEWRAAFILNKKKRRKSDEKPGAKTLWLGMRDIAVFVQGLRYARELGQSGMTCVSRDGLGGR